MNDKVSKRVENIHEPSTIRMARLSREYKERGIDIINLSLGEPDFNTPAHIRKAAEEAIEQGYSHYTPVAGYLELKQAIVEKFKKDNGLTYQPENIVVSTGAKQSLMNIIMSIVNARDEVLVPTPFWVTYPEMIKLAGGIPVFVEGKVENDFKITPAQLAEKITPKTKAIIYSSPCNPSGSFFRKEELAALGEVLKKHEDIFIISDEIYEHINYTGKHSSIAEIPELFNRTAVVNGVSKSFAMTGWRIGYMGAPAWLASACDKFQGQFTSGACSISQRATITALSSSLEPTYQMRDAFKKRRDLVIEKVKNIPHIKYNIPEGAFYLFPDMSWYFGKSYNGCTVNNADDLSMYLFEEAKVSTVSGSGFGNESCIRISFAASEENLTEAFDRIATALTKLG
ncbi:MAG: pyridoxal phosphate-dependent aminotransferase [Bacteroidetes bacterium]|nr:pyridoxal phosphate-dependent aminotransferase [Bacteroidota bacterium]